MKKNLLAILTVLSLVSLLSGCFVYWDDWWHGGRHGGRGGHHDDRGGYDDHGGGSGRGRGR